jgi:hypothetical protein
MVNIGSRAMASSPFICHCAMAPSTIFGWVPLGAYIRRETLTKSPTDSGRDHPTLENLTEATHDVAAILQDPMTAHIGNTPNIVNANKIKFAESGF